MQDIFIASDSELSDFEMHSSIGVDDSLDYAQGLDDITILLLFNLIALGVVAGVLLGVIFWRKL